LLPFALVVFVLLLVALGLCRPFALVVFVILLVAP